MLYPRDESVTRECPKGPKRVVVSERIVAGIPIAGTSVSGTVRLQQRIDDVVGFRVCYVTVSKENPVALADGTLLVLSSMALGSKLALNPFIFANTTDTANGSGIAFSDVIAVVPHGRVSGQRIFAIEEVNQKLYFTSAFSIDFFDWTLSPVQGNFALSSACALELIIEFYTLCRC